jgi:hypothetical protein
MDEEIKNRLTQMKYDIDKLRKKYDDNCNLLPKENFNDSKNKEDMAKCFIKTIKNNFEDVFKIC